MNIAKGGLFFRAALLFALTALTAGTLRRFRRYEVSGESMRPTFLPGDYLLVDAGAYRSALPRPGHLVLACLPHAPAIEVVKRVAEVHPEHGITLLGDNPASSTDSRHYGPLPLSALVGRVVLRYWPVAR